MVAHIFEWCPIEISLTAIVLGFLFFSSLGLEVVLMIKVKSLMHRHIFSLNRKINALLRRLRSGAHRGERIALIEHTVQIWLIIDLFHIARSLTLTLIAVVIAIEPLALLVLSVVWLQVCMIALFFHAQVLWLLFGKVLRLVIANRLHGVEVTRLLGLHVLGELLMKASLSISLREH